MSTKHLSTASFLFMGATTLPAQTALITFQKAEVNETNLGYLVGLLTQNAMVVLLSIALVMGIAWLFYIWKACAHLNKKSQKARTYSSSTMLCIAVILSIFSSSCAATQQTQAANIREARWAESNDCICHAPFRNRNYPGYAGMYNLYPYSPYNSPDSPFCKYCGRRMNDRNQ